MMGASVTVRSIAKRYGESAAVDDVSLDVRAGEFVSLLGPSGCGKTTTLRMIAGLESVDAGTIAIDGRDVTHVAPQGRGIGMVFQHYALFPNLTAYENIAFALRIRRLSRKEIDRRVRELLETVHLGDADAKYPHELSGGMQQRVALARALAIAPRVLLLDEPLSALDAAIREALRIELRRLQRQLDMTVIYVTHDQAEAMALSDTIVVVEKGRVSQSGTPRDLYNRPTTPFTAAFVGSSTRRESTIERTNGQTAIRWGTATLTVETADTFSPGQRVLVQWRPESATIAAIGSLANTLRGVVELVTFLGPMTRVDVRAEGDGEPVSIDVASNEAEKIEIGASIALNVPRKALRVYALSEPAPQA